MNLYLLNFLTTTTPLQPVSRNTLTETPSTVPSDVGKIPQDIQVITRTTQRRITTCTTAWLHTTCWHTISTCVWPTLTSCWIRRCWYSTTFTICHLVSYLTKPVTTSISIVRFVQIAILMIKVVEILTCILALCLFSMHRR